MGQSEKDTLKVNNQVRNRRFDYSKGDVRLDFTLRTDVKIQLKSFLELLKRAVVDVEEELAMKGIPASKEDDATEETPETAKEAGEN